MQGIVQLKIDRLRLPVFNFIQVTEGTATDTRRDLEQTGEWDCGRLRKIIQGCERAGENIPRLYCINCLKNIYCIILLIAVYSDCYHNKSVQLSANWPGVCEGMMI